MTGTDPIAEARRLIKRIRDELMERGKNGGLSISEDAALYAADQWLASNPESKPAAGVTEALETFEAFAKWTCTQDWEEARELPPAIAAIRAALASAAPAAPETITGERAQIVKWLRARPMDDQDIAGAAADAIERGEHLPAAPAVSQPPADTRETGNG